MQEENREEKRGKGTQKEVKGREIMDGRKRKMEKEERKRRRQQERRQGRPCTGRRLSSELYRLRELFGLFQASGLWLQALNHRGQCEAGLFGDVFSTGPVCFYFSGSGHVCGREEGGDQGCGWH